MDVATSVDAAALEAKVQDMYRMVAQHPEGRYHFELGHALAERLGYNADRLHDFPQAAVESFAGVGFYFDLAELSPGEVVVDLGSGSGMDVFYAASEVGPSGQVLGIDFTPEQLDKARSLAATAGIENVDFLEAHIDVLPVMTNSVDCVISILAFVDLRELTQPILDGRSDSRNPEVEVVREKLDRVVVGEGVHP